MKWHLRNNMMRLTVLVLSVLLSISSLRAQCWLSALSDDLKNSSNGELKTFLDEDKANVGIWKSFYESGTDISFRGDPDLLRAFASDFKGNSQALQKIASEPELVDSWRILFKDGDTASELVRRNPENLEKLSKFMSETGMEESKLISSFSNAKDPQKWIDMKIPQDELDAAYDAMKNSLVDELSPWTKDHKAQRWANHKSGNPDADFNTWSNKYDGNIKKADAANSGVDDYFNTLGWNCTTCKEVTTKDITILTDDGLKTLSRRHDIADKTPNVKKAIEVKEYSSGKVYYSEKSIKTQVALDAYLLDSKEFLSIEWVFKGCEPSKPLEDALVAAGVTIKRIP